MRETAATTRAGFVKWAATSEGRSLIERFRTGEFEITIIESIDEEGPGRAPQPGLRTLLASGDASAVKHYQVILNPAIAAEYGRFSGPALGYPITPVDVMSTAWAAEMLHIDFYARGIPLPHHERPDFQERWENVASELGFPVLRHDTDR